MTQGRRWNLLLAAVLGLVTACSPQKPQVVPDKPDTHAVEAVSLAWKEAYNAGDFAKVTALYTEDAVLSAPGQPAVLGNAAIGEYFVKTIGEFSKLGLVVADKPLREVEMSGDLAWQWQTFTITDQSGKLVDAGKLVTLFKRVDGQWKIAGDTWSSDGTVVASAP